MHSSITSSKCHGRDPAPARARLLVTRAHSGVFIDPLCAENAADRARARCDSAAAWSAAVPAAVAGRPARRQAPGRAGRPPSAGETPALHAATSTPRDPCGPSPASDCSSAARCPESRSSDSCACAGMHRRSECTPPSPRRNAAAAIPAPARARLLVTRAHSRVLIDPLAQKTPQIGHALDVTPPPHGARPSRPQSPGVPPGDEPLAGRDARPVRGRRPRSMRLRPLLATGVALPRRPVVLPPLDVRNHGRLIRARVPECIDEANALLHHLVEMPRGRSRPGADAIAMLAIPLAPRARLLVTRAHSRVLIDPLAQKALRIGHALDVTAEKDHIVARHQRLLRDPFVRPE